MIKKCEIIKCLHGSLSKGDDIVISLTKILKENGIKSGFINAIGAVSQAKIGFFNPITQKYEDYFFDEPMELISLLGNISIKDEHIFPHMHITLARKDLSTIGGHLYPDTIVYALEFNIVELSGEPMVRRFDDKTGLFIWGE